MSDQNRPGQQGQQGQRGQNPTGPRGLSPIGLLGAGAISAGVGILVQLWLTSRGQSPFVPPYSMSVMLAGLAALLIVMALRLRKQIARGTGAVNPFQAVRLLATSRAGQIVGVIFFGFATGLLVALVGRSVPAPAATWVPMLVTSLSGLALLVCGIIAERLCRVPPGEDDASTNETGNEDPGIATLKS